MNGILPWSITMCVLNTGRAAYFLFELARANCLQARHSSLFGSSQHKKLLICFNHASEVLLCSIANWSGLKYAQKLASYGKNINFFLQQQECWSVRATFNSFVKFDSCLNSRELVRASEFRDRASTFSHSSNLWYTCNDMHNIPEMMMCHYDQ